VHAQLGRECEDANAARGGMPGAHIWEGCQPEAQSRAPLHFVARSSGEYRGGLHHTSPPAGVLRLSQVRHARMELIVTKGGGRTYIAFVNLDEVPTVCVHARRSDVTSSFSLDTC
jgi:hypothetical protein